MKLIKLTQGKFAKVDDDDFERISKQSWCVDFVPRRNVYYALTWVKKGKNKKPTTTRMHRVVMNAKKGQLIDHKNGDTLDNRKENLRFCTHKQNGMNKNISKNNKYGHVGIRKRVHKTTLPTYQAYIFLDGKQKNLGWFKDKEKAILAYVQSAKENFGDFYRDK